MLGAPNTSGASPKSRNLDLGFKRIWAVRAWASAGRTRYEVEGVVHRRPVTVTVTAAIATQLVATGIPLVIREAEGPAGGRSC